MVNSRCLTFLNLIVLLLRACGNALTVVICSLLCRYLGLLGFCLVIFDFALVDLLMLVVLTLGGYIMFVCGLV